MQRSVTELTRDKDKILQKLDDAYDKLKEDDKFVILLSMIYYNCLIEKNVQMSSIQMNKTLL